MIVQEVSKDLDVEMRLSLARLNNQGGWLSADALKS